MSFIHLKKKGHEQPKGSQNGLCWPKIKPLKDYFTKKYEKLKLLAPTSFNSSSSESVKMSYDDWRNNKMISRGQELSN